MTAIKHTASKKAVAAPDLRFFEVSAPIDPAAAQRLTGIAADDFTGAITHISEPLALTAGGVAFCDDRRLLAGLAQSPPNGGVCLTTPALAARLTGDAAAALDRVLVPTPAPRLVFAKIAAALYRERRLERGPCEALRGAAISDHAEIGEDAIIEAGATIGPGVVIGARCVIEAGASIRCAVIGVGVHIKPGARIGQSGFGFTPDSDGPAPIPQLGRVIIGDHVEIGANSTVDRGALGDTSIGDHTKIDNLVQIGHNVTIGRRCLVASLVGVSGSTVVGDDVVIGGQAGFADHLTIGDGAMIAARSGLMNDMPAGEKWGGAPAKPVRQWLREVAAVARLANAPRSEKE